MPGFAPCPTAAPRGSPEREAVIAWRVAHGYQTDHPGDSKEFAAGRGPSTKAKHARGLVPGIVRHFRRWRARIWWQGKYLYFGVHASYEAAVAVVKRERRRLGLAENGQHGLSFQRSR